jgi:hypothetical protein
VPSKGLKYGMLVTAKITSLLGADGKISATITGG